MDQRVESFMYGSKESIDDDAYQVTRQRSQLQKAVYLVLVRATVHKEIIYHRHIMILSMPIIIEEYGLIGGAFIMFIYLVFLYRCIRIFKRCPYAFGAFLALGLSFTLVIQAVANMAVTVNLFPVTGVTLPLVSMGGTSFIFTCFAIGIILSVARNVEQLEGKKMQMAE